MKPLRILEILFGSGLVAVWLPVFLGGLASLRIRGPLGKSDEPIERSMRSSRRRQAQASR